MYIRISLSEFLLLHMESTNQTKINYQMNWKKWKHKENYFNTNHLKSPKMIACSTILYRFNNLHLVGHNCLRISNTSDVPEFIKSCLIHHPPIYNWPFQTSSAFNITFIKITKHTHTSFPTLRVRPSLICMEFDLQDCQAEFRLLIYRNVAQYCHSWQIWGLIFKLANFDYSLVLT